MTRLAGDRASELWREFRDRKLDFSKPLVLLSIHPSIYLSYVGSVTPSDRDFDAAPLGVSRLGVGRVGKHAAVGSGATFTAVPCVPCWCPTALEITSPWSASHSPIAPPVGSSIYIASRAKDPDISSSGYASVDQEKRDDCAALPRPDCEETNPSYSADCTVW